MSKNKRSPNANCPLLEASGIDISQSGYETKNYSGMNTKEIAGPCVDCPTGEEGKCFFETGWGERRDIVIELCEYLYQKEKNVISDNIC